MAGPIDSVVKKVKGILAHDAADTAANTPVKVGGYGSTATPSATSADGDVTNIWVTRNGAVNVADGGGTLTVDDGSGSLTVDGLGIGATTDGGVIGDLAGSIVAQTRGINTTLNNRLPATIGQTNKAGSLSVALASNQDALPVTDNGGSLTVDGTVAVSSIGGTVTVSGTVSVNEPVSVDDNGGSLTVDGTVAVSSVGGTVTVSGAVTATGNVAHDAADSGNPLKIGGKAFASAPTAVADADRVDAYLDTQGRLHTRVQGLIAQDAADDNAVQYPIKIGGGGSTATPGAVSADGDIVNGWFTRSGALNVADGNSTLSVDDGAGSLTVDGTVTATDGGGSLTVDSAQLPTSLGQTTKAGSLSVTLASNQDALPITDNSGSLTVDDGGSSLTVDGSLTAVGTITNTVTVQGVIEQDVTDNNTTNKPVKVGGGGSTATPGAVSADGDIVNAWFDRNGRLNVADGGLTLSVDDGAGSLTVDGSLTTVDAVTAITNTVTVQGVIQQDTADNNTTNKPVKIGGGGSAATPGAVSADGDIVNAWFTTSGALNIADGNGSLTVDAAGDVAHDAVDSGNPLKIGGKASTSAPTAVANGDRVNAYFDANGRLGVQDGGGSLTVDNASFTSPQEVSWWSNDSANWPETYPALRLNASAITVPSAISLLSTASLGHGAWTATTKYIFIPIINLRRMVFSILNTFDQSITVEVYGTLYAEDLLGSGSTTNQSNILLRDAIVLATSAIAFVTPDTPATGGTTNHYQAQLNSGWTYITLKITTAGDPTSGQLALMITRSL